MTAVLTCVIGVASGWLYAWRGEPWMKRHPLAGCWAFAAITVFFAATAVLNAVTRQPWWAALEAVLAVASALAWRKYLGRRKAAKVVPA